MKQQRMATSILHTSGIQAQSAIFNCTAFMWDVMAVLIIEWQISQCFKQPERMNWHTAVHGLSCSFAFWLTVKSVHKVFSMWWLPFKTEQACHSGFSNHRSAFRTDDLYWCINMYSRNTTLLAVSLPQLVSVPFKSTMVPTYGSWKLNFCACSNLSTSDDTTLTEMLNTLKLIITS